MMRVRYYVLAKGQQFEVFREDLSKGASALRNRATDLAKTLARLETRFTRSATEVLVEDPQGHLYTEFRYDPAPSLQDRGELLVVGHEQVMLR